MECVMICHNFNDASVPSMSYHLAYQLANEGKNVVFISKAPYYEEPEIIVVGNNTITLTSWPSKIKNSSWKDIKWFVNLYKKFKPSLILGHYNGGLISIVIAKILSFGKVKTVEHHHTCSQGYILDKGKYDLKLSFFLLRRTLYYHLFCDYIICPSFYALNDLNTFFKYKSGYVIPHGLVDRFVDSISKRNSATIQNISDIKLGYLGRLDKGKNVDTLVRSLYNHHQKYPLSKINLTIAGFGLNQTLITKEEKSVPFISFIGEILYHEVDDYIKGFDFTIIPSMSDSFNLVAIESLMNNIPLIVTKSCGVSDFLKNEFDSIIIGHEYSDLTLLFEDLEQGKWKEKKLQSRETFLNKFEIQVYLRNIKSFLDSINN